MMDVSPVMRRETACILGSLPIHAVACTLLDEFVVYPAVLPYGTIK